ncbi:MAG: FAD-binding oxidoreductase [Actinobacteria bacterium]|nr:MAG: FAD-binding oxidoreductase [Actinomycetota bacterium]
MAVVEKLPLADLRRRHRGPVIGPDDGMAFDAARTTFNGMLDRRPALVTRPLDVNDVVASVSFAAGADLAVAVRGGGHGVAGHCVGDGSLVVDLRLMREVVVDPQARTATCGGGALWEDLDPPCQRHGLATPGGTFGDTGVAGLTLGGGIGHLMGPHGLTLDNLVATKVVTADGAVVHASEEENADLFWALRGGGGNFGVVVEFTFRLHPVGLLLGGLLMYRLEDAHEVFSTFRELTAEAADELVCFAQIFRSAITGDSGTAVSVAYFGDVDEGRSAIRPLTDGIAPIGDGVRAMYYPELQEIFGRMPFGLRNYWSGRFLRDLSDGVIDLTAATFEDPETMGGVLVECLHGAVRRVPQEATAFAGRDASHNATFISTWTDPAEDERRIAATRAYSAALAPWSIGEGYVNYASEMPSEAPDTERMQRLRRIKREYDPENRFRFNHNIAPQ